MKIKLVLLVAIVFYSCKKQNKTEETVEKSNIYEALYPSKLTTPSLRKLTVQEDALHFFAIGDWGRQGYFNQAEMGAMMQQISMVIEPEFIISTGDNFYPTGVASTQDPLWEGSFENIYKGNFLQVPWYVVLGNHDYKGNVQAQIEYSKISRRWTLPDRYWYKDFELEDAPIGVRLTFTDTNPLQDDYYTDVDYSGVIQGIDTIAQLKWLDKTLATKPKNLWSIVVGHHPLYTGGKRKNKKAYSRMHLERYLEKHQVDAFICGHEHDLQHIKPKDKYTHHFVSGAGSEERKTGAIEGTLEAIAETGIMVFSLTEHELLVQFVNYKGEVLYKSSINRAS